MTRRPPCMRRVRSAAPCSKTFMTSGCYLSTPSFARQGFLNDCTGDRQSLASRRLKERMPLSMVPIHIGRTSDMRTVPCRLQKSSHSLLGHKLSLTGG